MHSDKATPQPHSNPHLSILHLLLPRKCPSRCINRKIHTPSRPPACRLYLGIKRHHSYPLILPRRLRSSRQVCGATPSPARTTLQATSVVGTWKTMALLLWIILFRRRDRGRLGMYFVLIFFHRYLCQLRHGHTNGCITIRAQGVLSLYDDDF